MSEESEVKLIFSFPNQSPPDQLLRLQNGRKKVPEPQKANELMNNKNLFPLLLSSFRDMPLNI